MNVIEKLRKRITVKGTKRFRRGAVSRVAERIDVSRTAVMNWLNKTAYAPPGKATCAKLESALADETPWMDAKKPGPKGPWKKSPQVAK